MVGLQAYGQILFSSSTLGVGLPVAGAYNIATATQDPANVNAGIFRIDFSVPFLVPPAVQVQPVRIGIDWTSPGPAPFMPDGMNTHREVFPLPPALAAGTADEILDVPPMRVFEIPAPPPVDGRGQPASSKIELEQKLLSYRLLAIERNHLLIQFASFLGEIITVRPYLLDGSGLGTDSVQQGTVNEILFSIMAAGDLNPIV